MHDSVMLEAKGRPAAMIVTTEFVLEAETQRDALGMSGLESVVIAHPLSSLTDEEIAQRIEHALPQIERIWLGEAVTGTPARSADPAARSRATEKRSPGSAPADR
jgi:hypothetical protein